MTHAEALEIIHQLASHVANVEDKIHFYEGDDQLELAELEAKRKKAQQALDNMFKFANEIIENPVFFHELNEIMQETYARLLVKNQNLSPDDARKFFIQNKIKFQYSVKNKVWDIDKKSKNKMTNDFIQDWLSNR